MRKIFFFLFLLLWIHPQACVSQIPLLSRSEQANPDFRNALTIDVSSDGEYIAFAGWTRVMIYDAHTRRHLRTIHTFNVNDGMYVSSVGFDPSRSHELVLMGLAIAGGGLARRVDVTTGEILSTLSIDADAYRLCFLPNQGAWLETTYGRYGTIRIRDAQSGAVRKTFATGSSSIVTAPCVSRQGRVSWGQNDSLFQYDPISGDVHLMARTHYPMSRVAYADDGSELIAATSGLERFDATTGAFRDSIRLNTNINTMCVSSHDSTVIMNQGLMMQERKLSDFSLIRSWILEGLAQEATSVDGNLYVANSSGSLVRLRPDKSAALYLTDHAGPTTGVAYGVTGDWIVTCGSDAVINAWNINTGAKQGQYRGSEGQTFSCVATSDRYIAAGSDAYTDSSLVVWNLENRQIVTTILPEARSRKLLIQGDTLVVAAVDGSVSLYDIPRGQRVRQLPSLLSSPNALQLSAPHQLLSYSDRFATIVYNLKDASSHTFNHGGIVLGVCDDTMLLLYESQFTWASLRDPQSTMFQYVFSLHAPDSVTNQRPIAWRPDQHTILMSAGPHPGVTVYKFGITYDYIGPTFMGVEVHDSVAQRIAMEVSPASLVVADDAKSLAAVRSDGGVAVYSMGGALSVSRERPASRAAALAYPNPCNDRFWINMEHSIGHFVLYDALGRVAKSGNISDVNSAIDISELSPGAYVIAVSSGGTTSTGKVYKW